MRSNETILALRDVNAWYGESHVLHGVSLSVKRGECVTLLGRNGAGRTTLLRSILGLVDRRGGDISIFGRSTINCPVHRIARMGVGYCPEQRGIFASLTCEENLLLPPVLAARPEMSLSLDEIYGLFPNIRERRDSPGTKLSGGEQQMLAIGRILRTGATLLLLDEVSEGLAPVIVKALARAIRDLKKRGYTIVLVEQNFRFAAPLADRMLVIEHGKVVEEIHRDEVDAKMPRLETLLGV